jgi:hypothetical protein
VQTELARARAELATAGTTEPEAAVAKLSPEQKTVYESSITGDRKTLVADSFIPAIMAVFYLLILLYFRMIGGYKTVHIVGEKPAGEGEEPAR